MRSVLDWFSGLRGGGDRRAKRKTIELYLARLPALLAKDYGGLGPYTPAQVERALTRHSISGGEYSGYALAIFCDRDDVAEIRPEVDYDGLRVEIAEMFFDNNTGFKLRTVLGAANWGESFGGGGLGGGSWSADSNSCHGGHGAGCDGGHGGGF